MDDFALILASMRKRTGLTLQKLSEKSNLSKATIINYEKGRRIPRVDDLQKIADALGCEAKDLLPNPPQPPTPDEQTQSPGPGALSQEARANSAA
jgi:transcriptional regulator with XRE-family HTH domain